MCNNFFSEQQVTYVYHHSSIFSTWKIEQSAGIDLGWVLFLTYTRITKKCSVFSFFVSLANNFKATQFIYISCHNDKETPSRVYVWYKLWKYAREWNLNVTRMRHECTCMLHILVWCCLTAKIFFQNGRKSVHWLVWKALKMVVSRPQLWKNSYEK